METDLLETDRTDELPPCQWRNVSFSKDGRSWRNRKLWPTEHAAKNVVRVVCDILQRRAEAGQTAFISTLDGDLMWADYSYTIQIPVL